MKKKHFYVCDKVQAKLRLHLVFLGINKFKCTIYFLLKIIRSLSLFIQKPWLFKKAKVAHSFPLLNNQSLPNYCLNTYYKSAVNSKNNAYQWFSKFHWFEFFGTFYHFWCHDPRLLYVAPKKQIKKPFIKTWLLNVVTEAK